MMNQLQTKLDWTLQVLQIQIRYKPNFMAVVNHKLGAFLIGKTPATP